MEPIDNAFIQFKAIRDDISKLGPTLVTESDARMKVVDRIFFECLGWSHKEVLTEDPSSAGYIDYKFQVQDRARLIVEAKRDSRDLGCRGRQPNHGFVLSGPVFRAPAAKEGIAQAIRYCGAKNAELACVTNGTEWIVFRGNRLGDGRDTTEGVAFIFADLDIIEANFELFFNLLSYQASSSLSYRAYFQEAEGQRIRSTNFRRSLRSPASAQLRTMSSLATDIDRVMTSFFDRLTGDNDPDLLTECFVETNESRAADVRLAHISEEIVRRIQHLDTSDGSALTSLIERAAENKRHEFVVIIGTKGAGKSTFVARFFKKVIPPAIASECTTVKLNLADSPGEKNSVVDWLNDHLLRETESAIFGNEAPSYDELQGVFFDEYTRLRKGPWARLYETDKPSFHIKFGEWVEQRREGKPHDYIAGLIRHIVRNRKKLPVLVFDNTDHFEIEFQERVYQYARSIYERELCLVILPITDRTSWQLSRQGALQSFEHESLYLPTPQTQHVIRKRIEFVNERVDTVRERLDNRYFVARGISLTVENIAAFAQSLQQIFIETSEASRCIGRLANDDIRRALKLTRAFITSPHLNVEDLLKTYFSKTPYLIRPGKVHRALIRTNYDIYPSDQHEFVQNIFDLTGEVSTSPLLGIRMLQLLSDAPRNESGDLLLPVDQIVQYAQGMGLEERAVSICLNALLNTGLAQNYDTTITSVEYATQIEATPSGNQHLDWGKSNLEYLSAMSETTPILSESTYYLVRDSHSIWQKRNQIFLNYLLDEDLHYCSVPNHPAYAGQVALRSRLETTVSFLERSNQRS